VGEGNDGWGPHVGDTRFGLGWEREGKRVVGWQVVWAQSAVYSFPPLFSSFSFSFISKFKLPFKFKFSFVKFVFKLHCTFRVLFFFKKIHFYAYFM
jgi:hypothetical protein